MKEMGAVAVHFDARLDIKPGMGIATNVVPPIDNHHTLAGLSSKTFGNRRPIKACTYNKCVCLGDVVSEMMRMHEQIVQICNAQQYYSVTVLNIFLLKMFFFVKRF